MQKFKRGQLVEITRSSKGLSVGHRFIVTDAINAEWKDKEHKGVIGYKTDLPTKGGDYKFSYSPENWIKLVNPDNDDVSEFTFEELMDNVKSTNLVKEQ